MINHASDCAVHNMPANVPGTCDCGATGDTAPDPAEIDLEGLKANLATQRTERNPVAERNVALWAIDPLIAAVEALRDLVGGLNIDLVNAGHDNEALREQVAKLQAEPTP